MPLLVLLLQAPAAADPPIRNFLKVSPEFCTGGQPRPEHFARLKADGVKAVLNLRTLEEHRASEEQAAVEGAGLKYFSVPVAFSASQDSQVETFLRLTDDPENRPMFIHCAAAVRSGIGPHARAGHLDAEVQKPESPARTIRRVTERWPVILRGTPSR